MVNLDNQELYQQLDKENMSAQLHGLPQQCLDAWHKGLEFKLPADYRDIDKIVILGMGGSAIGGDLVRSLATKEAKLLIFVNRDYDLPPFVDIRTLVIASSYSGNTEETLSAFSQALKTGCKQLAMTTGGRLKEMAVDRKVPVFHIDHVSPPRAALGYGFLPIMAFLRNLGFLKGISIDVDVMVKELQDSLVQMDETSPCSANPAKRIAKNLFGKLTVIYGAGILGQVAHRWKTQINENSKAWATYAQLPELNHNAVVGYNFPPELARQIHVIFLQCPSLHHRTMIRYGITGELLTQNNISHQYIDSCGEDPFRQMMSLIYLGDWVSYYLAILYQIDPSPVAAVDYLKKRLSETR
jgi:glucose/mannose-6-phosphate isomerase